MRYFLLLILCLPLYVLAQTNTEPGLRDGFYLSLSRAADKENVNLYIDNKRATKFENGHDGEPGSAPRNMSFTTISSDNKYLIKDKRPYIAGTYYVDFPLSMKLEVTSEKEYILSVALGLEIINPNQAAVVFRIIDKSNPDEFIDLLEGPYAFKTDQAGDCKDRFVARVYAASVLKEIRSDNEWTNPENWWGGVPGEKGAAAVKNNCAIIPANTEVVIPPRTEISVNALLNSGSVSIEKDADLTITKEAKLTSFSHLYLNK
ncbi:MAG: hypothetical protein LBN74_09605 [Prevotella sp.]|jgi:hypothetical protein|nr:hypothetical protein [Prevotella sp.]